MANRLTINLEALQENIQTVDFWMREHGASWTLVTKVLCGHAETLRALHALGIRSMADSRLDNMQAINEMAPDVEAWYLRLPHLSRIPQVLSISDVSLNSELGIIEALNQASRRLEKIHRIIVMIELGDLREGIVPGSLVGFYENVFELSNVQVLGIGANLGCLSGAVPTVDQLTQLMLYRELLELKFKRKLQMISAGSSALLPMLLEHQVPSAINHFRIGEAVFLGTDLINGDTLPGLRDDVFTLETEVVEVKEKGLVPLGETTSMTPFQTMDNDPISPGQRGYRAIVTVGHLDTEISGLTPLNPEHVIAGASSDLTVINLGSSPPTMTVGDSIKFRVNYGALARLMSGRYIDKFVTPAVEKFTNQLTDEEGVDLPPVVKGGTTSPS